MHRVLSESPLVSDRTWDWILQILQILMHKKTARDARVALKVCVEEEDAVLIRRSR